MLNMLNKILLQRVNFKIKIKLIKNIKENLTKCTKKIIFVYESSSQNNKHIYTYYKPILSKD